MIELQKNKKGHNIVTYFMWYMLNDWGYDEAVKIFGDNLGKHIHDAWINTVFYRGGDNLKFYADLDVACRNKLVARAIEKYENNE